MCMHYVLHVHVCTCTLQYAYRNIGSHPVEKYQTHPHAECVGGEMNSLGDVCEHHVVE